MQCSICGEKVVNENNQLQRLVKMYKKEHGELDLKHLWIAQWKLCWRCANKYSAREIEQASQIVNGKLALEAETVSRKIAEDMKHCEMEKRKMNKEKQIARYIKAHSNPRQEGGFIKPKKSAYSAYGKAYSDYIARGDAAAIELVKNTVKQIDTVHKWVDIKECATYTVGGQRLGFKYIIAEIFPRKIRPIYPKREKGESAGAYKDRIAYITWETATRDIENQRQKGYEGPNYLILPRLINLNRGKKEQRKIYWDNEMQCLSADMENRAEMGRYEEVTVSLPRPAKWQYVIKEVKEISPSSIDYIRKNRAEMKGHGGTS